MHIQPGRTSESWHLYAPLASLGDETNKAVSKEWNGKEGTRYFEDSYVDWWIDEVSQVAEMLGCA